MYEDGPVDPKHVKIRRYMNKIEIVTSVGFSFHIIMSAIDEQEITNLLASLLVNKTNIGQVYEESIWT